MSELSLIILILKQICFGSLVSGFIVFFLQLFIQSSHIFDQDIDSDIDTDFDLDSDIEVGVDKDIHVGIDKDIHIDKEIHVDLDSDVDTDLDHSVDVDSPAPLMLLLGTFMITFGGTGTVLLNNQGFHPLFSIVITVIFPVLVTIGVSKLWARVAVEETYETALQTIKIDDEVTALTTVDPQGGLVLVNTSSIHGPAKFPAKTRSGAIPQGMFAYVVEIQGTTLIIDEWPTSDGQEKPYPEGQITWE